MKTLKLTLAAIMLFSLAITSAYAQTKGNGNVTTETREMSSFDAIKVGCAIKLHISQGDQQLVKVETDDNLQSRVITKVTNGTLNLECSNIQNPTKLDVYVTAVKLTSIDASGASKVVGETPVKSDDFALYTSGAAKVTMDIQANTFKNETSGAANNTLNLTAKNVNTEVSGAGTLTLKGSAETQQTEVSGAGNLKALEFLTDYTTAEVSGAGNARIMARKQLKANLSGAGSLMYFDKDNVKKIAKQGEYQLNFDGMDNVKSLIIEEDKEQSNNNPSWNFSNDDDTVKIVLNDKKVLVITDDSVRVNLGQRDYVISDNGVKIEKRNKAPKFNGHWAGFDLSINGLLNSDGKIDYPQSGQNNTYEFMDLNYSKSIGVNINFFEQNINLIQQHLGLVTGLGISWNNYRFSNTNTVLTHNGSFGGYLDTDPSRTYDKSKLMVTYLKVPLMLEFQTNSKMKANSFHIGGGVEGDVRLWSHSKIKYNGNKSKDKDDFYLNPFKFNAIARIGWGYVNLFGSYAFTSLFRSDKGPEAYPFEIGVTLAGF